jgi:hypothetical protein
MYLAKNKNGQIGRQVPGVGLQAKIARAPMGAAQRNMFASLSSIAQDQATAVQADLDAKVQARAHTLKTQAAARARQLRMRQSASRAAQMQGPAKFDPMNEALKRHFARQYTMGQTDLTLQSLSSGQDSLAVAVYGAGPSGPNAAGPQDYSVPVPLNSNIPSVTGSAVMVPINWPIPPPPANYSSSGGNSDIVPSDESKRPISWAADFRQHLIVGNPLTRDGVFGPSVTDYDRYVNGIDVNQTDVIGMPANTSNVAGGTMLGRWNGGTAPQGFGSRAIRRRRGFGDDGSDTVDTSSDTVDTSSQTVDTSSDTTAPPPPAPAPVAYGPEPAPAGYVPPTAPAPAAAPAPASQDFFSIVANSAAKALSPATVNKLASQLASSVVGSKGLIKTPTTSTPTAATPASTLPAFLQPLSSALPGVPDWAIYAGLGLLGFGAVMLTVKALKK